MKKLLIATPLSPPDIGGPATYSKLLLKELPEHGFDIEVVSFRSVRMFPKGIKHIVFFFKMLKKGKEVDIIYALDPMSVGLPSALAAFFLKKRFFVRLGGDYAWEQASLLYGVVESPLTFSKKYKEYPFRIRLFKEIQTEVARRAEKVIVPSEYLKKVVVCWGVEQKKIVVIHNTPWLPESVLGRRKVLRELLHFNDKLLISVGRLIPLKGFPLLIEIMPKLLKHYPKMKLVIVGDGPEKERLEKMIEKKKLEKSVVLTGALEQDVLFGYLEAADVFVLNALHETFSHQILEAMGLGIPVITTDVGGNPEIIEHGVSGILLPYNNKKMFEDTIVKVLNSTRFKNSLVMHAGERMKLFNRSSVVAKLVSELK